MKSLRVLIVDDEAAARKDLRELLSAYSEIHVVAEADCVSDAITQYRQFSPDLIFLDVQMPKRDGFSLLPELRPVPKIIFTTAYDCFAVKAFEVNAVDFLVKPISPERLELALGRLGQPSMGRAKPFQRDDYVFLSSDQELRVVSMGTITHIEADQNYSTVHSGGRKSLMVRRSMQEWTRLLPGESFLRVNRSVIVNLLAIREMTFLSLNRISVHFRDSSDALEIGRLSARRLRKAVKALTTG